MIAINSLISCSQYSCSRKQFDISWHSTTSNMSGNDALFTAVQNRNKRAVKDLLQDTPDINCENSDGITPLSAAVDALIHAKNKAEEEAYSLQLETANILHACRDAIDIVQEIAVQAKSATSHRYAEYIICMCIFLSAHRFHTLIFVRFFTYVFCEGKINF